METLILNGSPRPRGDTVSLIRELERRLEGETTVINAYTCGISPCVDCRYCWDHDGCALRDGWEKIDGLLRRCGAVVIASPLYFSQLTGPLLSLLSRLQQYYCQRAFQKRETGLSQKRGGILLVGGGDGAPDPAAALAGTLLRQMGCREIAPLICCHNTNALLAIEEPGIGEKLQALADFLEGRTKKEIHKN